MQYYAILRFRFALAIYSWLLMMATHGFNIYYQNTRGLRTKTHLFKRNLLLNSYDVISLSETWMLSGINDSELFDDRYVVWRRDRNYVATNVKYGGGVLLATRRDLTAVNRPEWSSSAEDVWVTVTHKNVNKQLQRIHFCTIYLCSEKFGNSFNTQLTNFTDNLSIIVNSCPTDMFVVMGDFNLSNIHWERDGPQYTSISGDTQIYFFLILWQNVI